MKQYKSKIGHLVQNVRWDQTE